MSYCSQLQQLCHHHLCHDFGIFNNLENLLNEISCDERKRINLLVYTFYYTLLHKIEYIHMYTVYSTIYLNPEKCEIIGLLQ